MGGTKAYMMELEEMHHQAVNLLVETGAVSRCPYHGDFYGTNMDEDALKHAYALGTIWVREGKVSGEREDFMAVIKSAYDQAGWDCPACEAHKDD